jgi:phospholipid/cholesterol/gamma-HCH transport system substrate-binding protein
MPGQQSFGWRRVRVAALVVGGSLLLAYGVYRVGRIFDVFARRYSLVTLVSNASGLREGAPVTLAGQRVGQIKHIDFIPVEQKHGENNLVVELKISERVRTQIRDDSRAYLRAQGLLGDKFIDINPGSRVASVLEEGDTIPAEQVMDIEQFLAQGGAVLDSASRAVADVRRITRGLAKGKGTMGQLLTSEQLYSRMLSATNQLQGTLAQFNNPNGTVGRLMHDPALYQRLISAVSRVDTLGGALLRGQGTLGRLIQSDQLYGMVFSGVSRADSALGSFGSLLNRLNNGNGTLQKLSSDPALYDAFLKAVVDLQTLIADLRANPKKFTPDVTVRIF